MIATTQSERLALIKKIAERRAKMDRINSQSKETVRKARKSTKRGFMSVPGEDTSKNPNYYTDDRRYAKEYYGDTFYETTRYDNEWD